MKKIRFLFLSCFCIFSFQAVAQTEFTGGWQSARNYGQGDNGDNVLLTPGHLAGLNRFGREVDYRRRRALDSAQTEAQRQELQRRRDRLEFSEGRAAALEKAVNRGIEWTQYGIGLVQSTQQLSEAWEALSELDREFDPDFANSGPSVPSHCAESEDCLDCYSSAVEKVNFNRFWIERARAIAVSTIRFANAASAFGDSASSIHGVSGIVWQAEGKPQITEAVISLRNSYRTKVRIYLNDLEQAMEELGHCEEEHYGVRDWYQRFGYIYVDYMRTRYAHAAD